MANFIPGQLYTNDINNLYGTKSNTVTTNQQAAGEPTVTWLCKAATKTFITFVGRSGHGTFRHLRKRRDALGDYVFPFGRFPGAPILRA